MSGGVAGEGEGRRWPIVGPGSAFSPLTLRAAIDRLTVHVGDEKTAGDPRRLGRRRSNGAIENTFAGIVDCCRPDRIY